MTPIEIADAALAAYRAVAFNEDPAVSHCDSALYINSRALVLTAFEVAFPDCVPTAVYEVWVDCNEDAAYCAGVVRRNQLAVETEAAYDAFDEFVGQVRDLAARWVTDRRYSDEASAMTAATAALGARVLNVVRDRDMAVMRAVVAAYDAD